MLIGYIRVSRSDTSQVLESQREALTKIGVSPDCLYEDLESGRKDDRPGLESCLKALQSGNTLVVWKLDRLGRDMKHLVTLVNDLNRQKVGLKVLSGAASIDTTCSEGKVIFDLFAVLAEFGQDIIRDRTRAGLTAARVRGRKGGRPRKVDAQTLKMAMLAMSDQGAGAQDVAKRLGITTSTLYMYVNGDGSPKELGTRLLQPSSSKQAKEHG